MCKKSLSVYFILKILSGPLETAAGEKDVALNEISPDFYQGDIILRQSFRSSIRHRTKDDFYRWTNNIIPYTISDKMDTRVAGLVEKAFKAVENYVNEDGYCLTFRRRIPETDKDYIAVLPHKYACASVLGRIGGEQQMVISYLCGFGNIMHESLHAIGLWHEQTRRDRDEYVQILWQNLRGRSEHEMRKDDEIDNLGTPYDYNSIMHYSRGAYSKNGLPTMIPTKDPTAVIGQRVKLSYWDIKRIRIIYKCDTNPVTPPTTTTTTPAPTTPPRTCSGSLLPDTGTCCEFTDGWCEMMTSRADSAKWTLKSENGKSWAETYVKHTGQFGNTVAKMTTPTMPPMTRGYDITLRGSIVGAQGMFQVIAMGEDWLREVDRVMLGRFQGKWLSESLNINLHIPNAKTPFKIIMTAAAGGEGRFTVKVEHVSIFSSQ